MSRVKFAEEIVFAYSSFLNFSGFRTKSFSDFWPKNVKNLSKLPSTCPEEQFVAWIFFLSFESFPIFCSNHWHGSQNSIYVSGVKNAEKNMFFCFSFQNCFEFWAIYFQTFGQNTSKVFKTIFCVSRGTICGLNFFKFWIVSDFLQKPLAWFSKFYLRVQSKNCGKNSFFCFSFHNIFSNFEQYIFRFLAKTLQKFSKLFSACPEEPFVPLIFF